MKFKLSNPFARFMNAGNTSTLAAPSADLVQSLIGFPAAAGKPVTRMTAVRVAAFLSAVKMLSNDLAKMPLILHEMKTVGGRQRTQHAVDNPLYPILKDTPNDFHTSFQLRWYLASQLIMNGNCYCQKLTDQAGNLLALIPLDAWHMTPHWDRTDPKFPKLNWRYEDGTQNKLFPQSQIWHVSNTNMEGFGIQGSTVIALAKEALSVLMAAEETAGRNFANGLGMGGFISFPVEGGPTEPQAQNIVDRLKKDFAGSQNAGKFSIIPMGGKWEKMTFTAQESQLLESRKWNEEEVVRLLGGAPLLVKLGLGAQNSTYASSSAFLDEYFNTSLLPFTTAIEQSITRDLIDKEDRGKVYAKHSADIILRGSPKERAETNKILIESSQLTPNEARLLEDRDSVEGGDVLIAAANACIFDIEEQEWFIPGQAVPEPGEGGAAPPAKPAKPSKTKARLERIANSLAERVMRKEAKGGIDAKFVAEVMNVSKEEAEAYIANRSKQNETEARAALVTLAQGE